jgi:hypothetical protein
VDTDAIITVSAACVCGSDLWPYRGPDPISEPTPMGHEYVGVVQQVGDQARRSRSATSWSDHSSPPTTPARSAVAVTNPVASTPS